MLTDLRHRLRALFGRQAIEHELDEELKFHFDRQVETYQRRGWTRADAERQARLDIGGFDQVKEEYRDALGVRLVHDLWSDVRQAARSLRSAPMVTLVAVFSLALAIG